MEKEENVKQEVPISEDQKKDIIIDEENEKKSETLPLSVLISNKIARWLIYLASFATIAVILVIPMKIIGTFLHECGHILSYIIFNPDISVILNTLQGYSAWLYIELEWYEDFWTAAAGMIFSSILLIIIWKKLLPRVKKPHYILKLALICLIFELILQGPIYLGLAFTSSGDPVMMKNSLMWYLRTQGIIWNPTWYFTVVGLALGLITLILLFKPLKEQIELLSKIIFKESITAKKQLILGIWFWIIYYIFRQILDTALNSLIPGISLMIIENPADPMYFQNYYAAGLIILFLIVVGILLNETIIRIQNPKVSIKNRNMQLIGAFVLITIILFPAFGWYTSNYPEVNRRTKDGLEYGFAKYEARNDGLYVIFTFKNQTLANASSQRDYSGIAIERYNYTTKLWSKPMILLQQYGFLDIMTDFAYTFDNTNRIWLFYVIKGDVLSDPQTNSTFFLKAWNLTDIDSLIFGNPTIEMNKSWIGMPITKNFITKADYDPVRNLIWIAYSNKTNPLQENSPVNIYFTSLNMTDYSLGNSTLFTGILSKYAIASNSYLNFHQSGRVDFIVADEKGCYLQYSDPTMGDPMANWSLPQTIQNLTFPDAYLLFPFYQNNQSMLVVYEDRDCWLEIYQNNWSNLTQRIRITQDYLQNYAITMFYDGAEYYQIITSYYGPQKVVKTINKDLTNWELIGDFALF